MNRTDFQQLAEIRLIEARALLSAELSDGAYYLAGYAVECALKACIAKRTQAYDFPDKTFANACYTHSLKTLLDLAELKDELNSATMEIQNLWLIVQNWSEASRYQRHEHQKALIFLDAIEDQVGGLLPWIRQRW